MSRRDPRHSISGEEATRPCAHCGRTITWRRKWANHWESVRYCGDACRREAKASVHARLEAIIRQLLAERGVNGSICPSEAARRVDGVDWRRWMEPVRRAARRMAHRGELVITRQGRPVDPASFRGPVRLALRR